MEWVLFALVALVVLVVGGLVVARPAAGASSRGDCQPIHYVFNPDRAPSDALDEIQAGLARTSAASGLRFVFDGLTNEQPSPQREGVPVLIAWADPVVFAGLTDNSDLVGWTHTEWVTTSTGGHLVSGWVYLNSAKDRPSGWADRQTWGGALLHEFGHLAGLGHSTDTNQMMYPTLLPGAAEWGLEDRAGLRQIGDRLGCQIPG